MKRLLTSSSALLWGLQLAFLNPVLALLLVSLFDATPADVGWVLAVYNAGGFVASIEPLGYPSVFALCAILTAVALVVVEVVRRSARRRGMRGE